MDLGLKGRAVIVAASSQGIGRATATAFAREGCKVAMCARNDAALRQAAEEIERTHRVPVTHAAFDVTDPAAVRDFVATVERRFGGIDVCVTNAGGPPAKEFLATTDEDWQRAAEQNLLSIVYFAREVIPLMRRKKWGRLITITRSEEHTSELQSRRDLVGRLLLEKKKKKKRTQQNSKKKKNNPNNKPARLTYVR